MKLLLAIQFVLLNVAGSFADMVELSREGLPSPHHRRSQQMVEELTNHAVQTYYIPWPEYSMFHQFFIPINRNVTNGQVNSIISMAISTDNTIIWYDHWEDKYDADATNSTTASIKTEVWGDGIAANGCRPTLKGASCTDASDVLMAGMSFVIQNYVTVIPSRDPSVFVYDGGDKVQTNFPIAITRGGYPSKPGSVLAGAMEVMDTSFWGKNFISPVGNNTVKASFSFTAFLVMAKEANTTVQWTRKSGELRDAWVLNEGESRLITTVINQRLIADKPVQVSIITGDIDSVYESRWYTILDTAQWSKQYVTPTGESFGKTKMVLYNANDKDITVTMETRNPSNGAKILKDIKVLQSNYALSPWVQDNTGAYVYSNDPFMAMSITDAERNSTDGVRTDGQMYDWGFSVQPLNDLTAQVLIAWGYGCTNNFCPKNLVPSKPRSVVWITPVENADLYIDYQNSGNITKLANIARLQSVKIFDPVDNDMSGAMIFATVKGGNITSRPVNIAASWGQDPVVSFHNQSYSLDLGTTVLPFFNVFVNKVVDKEYVSPDEYLIYTIRIYNLGQSRINGNTIRLKDTLDKWVDYVPNTTTVAIVNSTYIQAIKDNVTGTAFPLDDLGALIPYMIAPRGGMIDVTFEVKLKSGNDIKMQAETIVNTGTISGGYLPTLPFDAFSKVVYKANITLTNTVYLGNDAAGTSCPSAVEYVEGYPNTNVVYCFKITNNGQTYLSDVTLRDGDLNYTTGVGMLAPGQSVVVPLVKSILSNLTNIATVIGNPTFGNGTEVPDVADVNATDPSAVGILPFLPNITLSNTVYLGSDSAGASCSAAVEYVEGYKNSDVVYCFNITNNGNTHLSNITLTNGALAYNENGIVTLAPGESVLVPFVSSILSNLTNTAVVVGNPVLPNGSDIADLADVSASDPSAVGILLHLPNITLSNTVYQGSDSAGASCSAAVEYVEGYKNTDVVYCFNITNNGNTHLSNITLTNGALAYNKNGIVTLAPGESVLVPFVSSILSNLTNTAVVVGNPVLPNGSDIADLADVSASDPSAVGLLEHKANISITNTVYKGGDSTGASCPDAVEFVEGFKGTSVVYCFNITNTGNTHLSAITLTNNDLAFNMSGIMNLAPGQSVLVPFKSSIVSNLTNVANVSGNPVFSNGTDIADLADVNAGDPSEVGILVEDYTPPNNETCLQDSWNENRTQPVDDLICTTKEVYVETLVSKPITCVLGSYVNVSVSAFISLASTRSDLGWYIAADGGDALEGNCIVEGLEEAYTYRITETQFGGEVTWLDDECGDVTINGTGALLEVPTFVHATIKCDDENKDNMIDLSVCFTWNTADTDGLCSLTKQTGKANLLPGDSSMCYCEAYNIPNSTVVDPNDDVVPCS